MSFRRGVAQRALEHLELARDALLHEPEPGLVVVPDAEVARLVLDVVLRDEADVRLEERAAFGHERQLGVGDLAAVRDGEAPGVARRRERRTRRGRAPRCACRRLRASSQAAAICASDSVWPPPSRMLFDAKILIRSAPRGRLLPHPLADLVRRAARVAERA